MKAAVVRRYGPPEVVSVTEVPRPSPRAGDALVRVHAVAVTAADSRIRAARFPKGFGFVARLVFGIIRPRRKVLGSSFSGVIEAVGARVNGLAPGDEVCGMTGIAFGAHAEYVAVAASKLARKPAGVSHEDAAGVLFGGATALYFLRDKASIDPGTTVLVNGASGAIGTNAVQLAKFFGAQVTGVTSSANVALVTELGATQVIDYTQQPLADVAERFDVVLDAVGNLSIAAGRRLVDEHGVLVLAVATLAETIRARGNVVAGPAPERTADFELLLKLVADGELSVVIDQRYELADITEAHRRVDTGHKIGNIIVCP